MTESSFQTLGRYTIRAEIGRGGFATVYQALDTSLNREVALKVLHPQMSADRTFVERFRKEARTLAGLRHPHIITVYEVSEVEGRLFIAMELAHGPSLAQAIVDRKRFPWSDALAVLKPVCDALDYAHGQGVVHRDLKPANVLLDAERGPLLTDFGFARLLGDSSASMSLSGGILGTPAYIAPEVWELDTATPAADIYALGCIACEMLTGEVLFVGKTPMQSMRAHDRGPQFPTGWPSDVPPGVEAALQVALARKPENRYPKATTFWHALNDLEANAQVTREQAERQAVADQWKAEAMAAMAASEWSAAKMAVGRWLSITPDDPEALAARKEIERQLQLESERQQKEEAERAAQAAIALEAARKAEDARARKEAERKTQVEADRKAKEAQERQRQAELAAQAAAAEKAKQEAVERERQKQAREAARLAEEESRRKELATSKQQAHEEQKQQPQAKLNRKWLYVAGGVIAVIVLGILFASTSPFTSPATPVRPTEAPVQPTEASKPTEAPATQAPAITSAPVQVTWYIGLGTGSSPDQIPLERAFAEKFNASHSGIHLVPQIVDNAKSRDTLTAQLAAGIVPDIVGPVGNAGRAAFPGQWADLEPLMKAANYDLGDIDPVLLDLYKIEGKLESLPFLIFPSAIYVNVDLFKEAGLPLPPTSIGEKYTLDGQELEWNFDTVAQVARRLTVDKNGNNANSPNFDKNNIVQYGFNMQWNDDPRSFGSFFCAYYPVKNGQADIPDCWKAAWKWYYDAIWGKQPFMPNQSANNSNLLDNGNAFSSGRVAMGETHLWYTCCIDTEKVKNLAIAVAPSYNGTTTAKMHGDSFAIMAQSKNPEAAFEVYQYMLGEGWDDLYKIYGLYGGMPARKDKQANALKALTDKFGPVNWQVFLDMIPQLDVPNHEVGLPNNAEAIDAFSRLGTDLRSNGNLDIDNRVQQFIDELNAIYSRK